MPICQQKQQFAKKIIHLEGVIQERLVRTSCHDAKGKEEKDHRDHQLAKVDGRQRLSLIAECPFHKLPELRHERCTGDHGHDQEEYIVGKCHLHNVIVPAALAQADHAGERPAELPEFLKTENKPAHIEDDDRIDIALGERNPDGDPSSPYVPLTPKNNIVNWEPGMDSQNWMENGGTVIGDDLLLAPDTEYKLHIVYTQELSGINPVTGERNSNEISAIYTITAPKLEESMNPQTGEYQFMGGLIYNINIGVYGLRPLEMNVGLEGWEEGGNIDVQGDPLEDGSD